MNSTKKEDASASLGKLVESYTATRAHLNSSLLKFKMQYISINNTKQTNINATTTANNDVLSCMNRLTEHVAVSSIRIQATAKTQLLQVKEQLLAVDLMIQVMRFINLNSRLILKE
jgi:hypothetical protein